MVPLLFYVANAIIIIHTYRYPIIILRIWRVTVLYGEAHFPWGRLGIQLLKVAAKVEA